MLIDLIAVGIALLVFLRLLGATLDRAGWRGDARRLGTGAGAAFFVLFIGAKGYYGMDAQLVLLLGLIYLSRVFRLGPLAPGAKAALIDGLLLALLFLARVDSLPLIAAAAAVMTVEAIARRGAVGPVMMRLAVTALLCAPYLIWSIARFGTWLPVSARIKSGFPVIDLGESLEAIRHTSLNLTDQAGFLTAWLLAWVAVVVLAPRFWRALRIGTPLEPSSAALGVFALYLAGRLSYMLLFSRADVQGSYAILAHVFNVLIGATAVGAWARRDERRDPMAARRLTAIAAATLGLVVVVLLAGKLQASFTRARAAVAQGMPDEVALGREIHARTRPGDVLFGGSFGLLGFFTDRSWINGAGVVNSYDYQRVFLSPGTRGRGGLEDYLRTNRVTHVVFVFAPGTPIAERPILLQARSLLYQRTNTIEVRPEDIVLVRRVNRGLPGGCDLFLVRWHP